MKSDAWNSHLWSDEKLRRIDVQSGKCLLQLHCSRCGRDFVEDLSSGERHAVYLSLYSLSNLPHQIGSRWLGELCPGAPLPFDIEVRSRLIHHHAR
jgi:hypothetical protein